MDTRLENFIFAIVGVIAWNHTRHPNKTSHNQSTILSMGTMKTVFVAATLIRVGAGLSLAKHRALNSPQFSIQIDRSHRSVTVLSSSISSSEDLLPGFEAIDAANDQVSNQLSGLRHTPYFSLYSVDILASCEYMPQELFECYSETCEVYPVDDEEVRYGLKSAGV